MLTWHVQGPRFDPQHHTSPKGKLLSHLNRIASEYDSLMSCLPYDSLKRYLLSTYDVLLGSGDKELMWPLEFLKVFTF